MGIFSRFSVRGGGHRRTQTALNERKGLPSGSQSNRSEGVPQSASPRGIEVAVEFKPVERPSEPLDNDQPIQCPFPDSSILNDGRRWRERASSAGQRKAGAALTKPPRPPPNRMIVSSISAPEHDILKLLNESSPAPQA